MMLADDAIPACSESERRALILRHPALNGLDFVEYRLDPLAAAGRRHVLEARFLKGAPAIAPGDVSIEGGARIVGIGVVGVDPPAGRTLRLYATDAGDFSIYTLRVLDPAAHGLDGVLASAPVNFRAGCPTDLDCKPVRACPEPAGEQPALDLMARDFASFRRMLLDLAQARNPRWLETHPAEPATALVELLAAEGDRLAWMQDAVGTEAYLETCRLRVSGRRHARLVDYRMHDGRNAFGFVQLDVDGAGVVPAGTRMLTRITDPLRGQPAAPGPLIPSTVTLDFEGDPALAGAVVFEATARVGCRAELNRLWIHDFGGRACCLPKSATSAYLYAVAIDTDTTGTAFRPPLAAGDWLLLHEALGPETGAAPDADPLRRAAVRIEMVEDAADPAFRAAVTLPGGVPAPLPVEGAAGDPLPADAGLPLLRVTWREAEAPRFALTVTGRSVTGAAIPHVGQARGNVVPVDHGRTVVAGTADGTLAPPATRGRTTSIVLPDGPLTFQPMPAEPRFDAGGRLAQPRHELDGPADAALPAVVLLVDAPGEEPRLWRPVPDLLDSTPFDEHLVAEVDVAGVAALRFGDDAFGRRLPTDAAISARFRIGNGLDGNLGAGALVHAVAPSAAELADPADPDPDAAPPGFPGVLRVWQPLSARVGLDPETLPAVRQRAPSAMHATQFRAVTEQDWEAAALLLPGVAAARATIRWTGSWHTVFVALHPLDRRNLVALPGGGAALDPAFAAASLAALNRWRLAGRDLAVRAGQYVPIRLVIGVCLAPGHVRTAVLPSIRAALTGSAGVFDPALSRFGETLFLSRIAAAVMGVPGASSCVVRAFHRYWALPAGELAAGRMEFGTSELPRLDADPSRPENGVLILEIDGEG